MIAQRFRPVVWVVGCSFAATALYTVSLGVASERTRLEELDQSIAMTRRDIRQLQTEMGTRASLRQLERWNGEVLALAAPSAAQFRATETALRTIDGSALPADGFAPPPVMVAGIASVICGGLVITAMVLTGDLRGFFLIWNLLLAWLPLLFGLLASRSESSRPARCRTRSRTARDARSS